MIGESICDDSQTGQDMEDDSERPYDRCHVGLPVVILKCLVTNGLAPYLPCPTHAPRYPS